MLFRSSDAEQTAEFFFWFVLSLALWAAQGLYARAFYAAGDTRTPMIAGTIVTVASLPVYSWLFDRYSVVGLAMASDLGILAHTLALALLLDRRKLVSLSGLPWKELGKALLSSGMAAMAAFGVRDWLSARGHVIDREALALISLTWLAVAALWLWITRSDLPGLLRRRRPSPPPISS